METTKNSVAVQVWYGGYSSIYTGEEVSAFVEAHNASGTFAHLIVGRNIWEFIALLHDKKGIIGDPEQENNIWLEAEALSANQENFLCMCQDGTTYHTTELGGAIYIIGYGSRDVRPMLNICWEGDPALYDKAYRLSHSWQEDQDTDCLNKINEDVYNWLVLQRGVPEELAEYMG